MYDRVAAFKRMRKKAGWTRKALAEQTGIVCGPYFQWLEGREYTGIFQGSAAIQTLRCIGETLIRNGVPPANVYRWLLAWGHLPESARESLMHDANLSAWDLGGAEDHGGGWKAGSDKMCYPANVGLRADIERCLHLPLSQQRALARKLRAALCQ
jgi:transcriptional regulator with XRE-family HTH domain